MTTAADSESQQQGSGSPSRSTRAHRGLVLILIICVSVILFLIAALIGGTTGVSPATVLVSVAASLAAISVIDWLWQASGGAPLERQIDEFRAATQDNLTEMRRATAVLGDLEETGIFRLWPERKQGEDQKYEYWAQLAATAKQLDIMGLTLFKCWFGQEKLVRAIRAVLTQNLGTVRITLLDRDQKDIVGASAYHRAAQPGERRDVLLGLLGGTYSELATLAADPSLAQYMTNGTLSIRLVADCTFYALILRIDDYMYVAPYLASQFGDSSLALSINGRSGTAYKIYERELGAMHDCGAPYGVPATNRRAVPRENGGTPVAEAPEVGYGQPDE